MNKIHLKIGKYFYENTIYLTLTWTILMFLMFIKINYFSCLQKLDFVKGIENIFLFFMLIFLTSGIFFILFSRNIRKNKREIMDKNNSQFTLELRNHDDIKINILPLFYIWIFSLSKIVISLYDYFYKSISIDLTNYFLMIWVGLFLATLFYWCKFKYKASVKYSIKYLLFVTIYTLGIIFWQELVPYVKNILLLKNCIVAEIING